MAKEKKMGRPVKEIDEDLLYKLAQIHCTMKEMVDIIGVSEDTLKRRYAGIIDKGKAEGKMRLRRKQIEDMDKINKDSFIGWPMFSQLDGYSCGSKLYGEDPNREKYFINSENVHPSKTGQEYITELLLSRINKDILKHITYL